MKTILPFLALTLCACNFDFADAVDNQSAKEVDRMLDVAEDTKAAINFQRNPDGKERVKKVKDGDTFTIGAEWSPYDLEWSIRVDGIDTPEKGTRAKCGRERDLSKQASDLTKKLLNESGNRVTLRNVGHDKYGGRLDATVILEDGRSLGDELLKAGLAKRYNGGGPKPNWCY